MQPAPKTEDLVPSNLPAIIDKAGELHEEIEDLEDRKESLGILREAIQTRLKLKPENEGISEGQQFTVVISAASNERELTEEGKALVYDILGKKMFLQLCSITLGKLDAVLSKEQVSQVTNKTQTGSRRFKFVRLRRRRGA